MNPGPLTCEASALPLSYTPDEAKAARQNITLDVRTVLIADANGFRKLGAINIIQVLHMI